MYGHFETHSRILFAFQDFNRNKTTSQVCIVKSFENLRTVILLMVQKSQTKKQPPGISWNVSQTIVNTGNFSQPELVSWRFRDHQQYPPTRNQLRAAHAGQLLLLEDVAGQETLHAAPHCRPLFFGIKFHDLTMYIYIYTYYAVHISYHILMSNHLAILKFEFINI